MVSYITHMIWDHVEPALLPYFLLPDKSQTHENRPVLHLI